ncbi:hypothetical protein ACFQE1_08265 [Halobium palmae]|uniref:DUF7344 domain-containing protein n=1 Tax=Halobium palmae TaxID=1776492 RepID=A0ABD5RY36_9EURY
MNRGNSQRPTGGSAAAVTIDDGTSTDADERSELSKDDLFHVLQSGRRRLVLSFLRGATGPVDMREIAERLAAWENEKPLDDITSEERQRAYIALYQSHLPKLDEMGAVEYEQSRGVVTRLPVADQFNPYLDVDAHPQEEAAAVPAGTSVSVSPVAGFSTVIRSRSAAASRSPPT